MICSSKRQSTSCKNRLKTSRSLLKKMSWASLRSRTGPKTKYSSIWRFFTLSTLRYTESLKNATIKSCTLRNESLSRRRWSVPSVEFASSSKRWCNSIPGQSPSTCILINSSSISNMIHQLLKSPCLGTSERMIESYWT